ncbi:MAG: hypothetical protein HKO92_11495 [Flavobacteriaceae bacterium]|nr:hypothetical protein [Bacteroidia bacterium]NNK83738.1 hypothetical protein [Flavobacteriaceae bacterium]
MLKRLLSIVLLALISMNAFAQDEITETKSKADHNISLSYGIVTGDATLNDLFISNLKFDYTYLHNISDYYSVGFTEGLSNLFDDDDSEISSMGLKKDS